MPRERHTSVSSGKTFLAVGSDTAESTEENSTRTISTTVRHMDPEKSSENQR